MVRAVGRWGTGALAVALFGLTSCMPTFEVTGPPLAIEVRADELPPGKGKVVHFGGREIAVYNEEGRYFATLSMGHHLGGPLGERPASEVTASICHLDGHFDVAAEDSPARQHEESAGYAVDVHDGDVVLIVSDGGEPTTPARPPLQRRGAAPRLTGARRQRREP